MTKNNLNIVQINVKLLLSLFMVFVCSTDSLMEGVDLAGIDVIDQDRRFIKQARKEVETQADKMLGTGLETQVKTSDRCKMTGDKPIVTGAKVTDYVW